MLDQRGQLLREAAGFAGCATPSYDRALWALRTWLDSRSGVGHVAVGSTGRVSISNSRSTTIAEGARLSWGIELDVAGRCGDLDSAVEGDRVWMTCTCGAVINRSADDD